MAEVSYDIPEGLPDAGLLSIAAQRLVALPEAKEREEAVLTLFKVIDNVLAEPEEPKKRRLKRTNEVFHRKVGRHQAALDFLRGCGFVEGDDPDAGEEGKGALLSMPVAFMLRLTDAHHSLAQAAQQASIETPPLPSSSGGSFNPYQSSFQATDSTRKAKATEAWKSEADKLREEVKRRELEAKQKVEQAAPVELNPSAFWLSSGRRLEEVIREAGDAAEERAADNALLQEQVAHAKNAIAGVGKFESADKKRLAEINRKRVYERCILRVICPDKSVLQVTFRAADTGAHVLEQIAPLLAAETRNAPWYLYQSPPMKRLAAKETLQKAGLTPGANMYLGFEGSKPGPPYLEASLETQLGPAPEGSRGVNQAGGFEVTGKQFSGEAMGWGAGRRLGGAAPAAAPAANATAPTPMEEG